MEWARHIASLRDLDAPFDLTGDLLDAFGSRQFTRIAFGTEFCEHLIPEPAAVSAAVSKARERGLGFTLLTPYASDRGIAKIHELLPLVQGEVVFNDWGVLNLLRREFPHLEPVAGRLLNKSLRDPRITGMFAETSAAAPASSLRVLQQSSLDSAGYTQLLARFGIARVEMDSLPQGQDLSFTSRGVAVTIYAPFGFVATSRVCMAAGLHYRKPDKFQPGAPCRHECQTHEVEYTYTNSPFANRDQKFLLKGNTYFFRHSRAMIGTMARQAAGGEISRIVVQPELPMYWTVGGKDAA